MNNDLLTLAEEEEIVQKMLDIEKSIALDNDLLLRKRKRSPPVRKAPRKTRKNNQASNHEPSTCNIVHHRQLLLKIDEIEKGRTGESLHYDAMMEQKQEQLATYQTFMGRLEIEANEYKSKIEKLEQKNQQ